jgi:uncharacterized protein (TIGR02145 family)
MKTIIVIIVLATALTSCGEHSFDDEETSSSSSRGEPLSSSRGESSSSVAEGGGSGYSALVGKGNDIRNYKTVEIGSQTWMAENLDNPVDGSICYNNEPRNCEIYGRLYDYRTAMSLPYTCYFGNCYFQMQIKHQGICPDGWHIPRDSEWDILIAFVHSDNNLPAFDYEDSPYAGKYLKAKNGWRNYPGIVNEDKYGFAALPGGGIGPCSNTTPGYDGNWWSTTEYYSGIGFSFHSMYDDNNSVDWYDSTRDDCFYSVRCLKD